jgi:ATP-dependent protease ClpP protease subunit
MGQPDYNYRINPARAIYILGEFADELLKRTVPAIIELRFENREPISVVINSHGGDATCLEAMAAALKSPDADGNIHRIVASVVGVAASAGAILLTLGDYSVATPTSVIYFHGIRLSEYEVTTESAAQVAASLSRQNRTIASAMTQTMVARVMHRYTRLKDEVKSLCDANKKKIPLAKAFIACVERRTTNAADRVLNKAIHRLGRIRIISQSIARVKFKPGESEKSQDAKVLKIVIDYHVRQHKNDEWELNSFGTNQVVADFLLVREFYSGELRGLLDKTKEVWGPEFLADDKLVEYNTLKGGDPNKLKEFIDGEVSSIVEDFWYLTVSIARALLEGENQLTAKDAYWIGAIDEITGDAEHYGMRSVAENDDPSPAPISQPIA